MVGSLDQGASRVDSGMSLAISLHIALHLALDRRQAWKWCCSLNRNSNGYISSSSVLHGLPRIHTAGRQASGSHNNWGCSAITATAEQYVFIGVATVRVKLILIASMTEIKVIIIILTMKL